MGTFSIGGLSTGLDTKGIIDQLLAIDSRPKVKLEWNKALWEARKSGWNDLNGRLNSLQTFANTLNNPSTWSVFSGISSSDITKVTGSSFGTTPAAGDYEFDVTQLAATEKWAAASTLPGATAGQRRTGIWYEAVGNPMEAADRLTTTKRGNSATLAGINTGSTITMNWFQDGQQYSSTFNVTATSTVQNLMDWAEAQIPGATTTLNGDGSWEIVSPAGNAGEITGFNFTARNAAGTVLANWDGSPHSMSSMTVDASDGGVAAADTLQITQGSSTWYVNVAQGDNIFDIVNAVNAVSGIGVTATQNAGLLEFTAKDSGAAQSFTVTSSGALAATLGLAETTAGQDSAFTVNGTAYTRSKNTGITDVITDVSVDLLNLTGGTPATLTVGTPAASVADQKKKILDFVNQYNEVIDFVSAKTAEKKIVNPKNLGEFLQGPLSRDYRFSSIGFDLRKQVGDIVQGLAPGEETLASIGITTGEIGTSGNTSGRLQVDEAKLEQALNTDPQHVRDLLTKVGGGPPAEDGIARRISTMVSQWRTGGAVDSALDGATSQIDSLQKSIDRFSERLTRKQSYYEKMFARLETNVGRIQNQNSFLSGQFAALMNGGGQ